MRTKADLSRAVVDLFEPLLPHFSEAGARVRLGGPAAVFGDDAEHLEGFARPLWGIVPLVAGGGTFAHWDLYARGLDAGTDPSHPEYWGGTRSGDQRMVEMAAIGYALATVPERLWDRLRPEARDNTARWLSGILEHEPAASNWQWFRVTTALGLRRVGVAFEDAPVRRSLDAIDGWYRGDGWYVDGDGGATDWYVPWAMHTYGLLYSATEGADAGRAQTYRERAAAFAPAHREWFDPTGGAVPFGRSLTYRTAQAAFWSALVAANVEALPWAEVKGLWLRNLRWWAERPAADRDGVLALGYGYRNLLVAEEYSSPGSPYWSMKGYLGLAAPDDHPVWTVEEEPLPPQERPAVQAEPGMVLSRDATQVVALSVRHNAGVMREGEAKYARFAYSSRFAFSLALAGLTGPAVADCSLELVDVATGERRRHTRSEAWGSAGDLLWCRWRPWPDVEVTTVLSAHTPWHVRVHRIVTGRRLDSEETGFAVPWAGVGARERPPVIEGARVASCGYTSTVVDLGAADREGRVAALAPNANLLHRRVLVPLLAGRLEPGNYLLAAGVGATDGELGAPPSVPPGAARLADAGPAGR